MSLAAFQLSDTLVAEEPVTATPLGAVGACVSGAGGQVAVAAVTLAFVERLPAMSTASTPNEYDVPQARPVNVVDVEVVEPVELPSR